MHETRLASGYMLSETTHTHRPHNLITAQVSMSVSLVCTQVWCEVCVYMRACMCVSAHSVYRSSQTSRSIIIKPYSLSLYISLRVRVGWEQHIEWAHPMRLRGLWRDAPHIYAFNEYIYRVKMMVRKVIRYWSSNHRKVFPISKRIYIRNIISIAQTPGLLWAVHVLEPQRRLPQF